MKKLPYTGIDTLLKNRQAVRFLKNKKVGVLSNQAAVTQDFVPSSYALNNVLDKNLNCIFSPEHGWSSFQAEGKEIDHETEPYTGLPVYSLYGAASKASRDVLKGLDVLIIDIQDVGLRCYTYGASCAKVLEHLAAEQLQLQVIVCDRPNPLGDTAQGPAYDPAYRSLVSYLDVPFQHGQSIGSLLSNFNASLTQPVPLEVYPYCESYNPDQHIWIAPSPGLASWNSVYLYPGLVLLEGTNVSEGRGTSVPFNVVMAPDLNAQHLVDNLNAISESGIKARPFHATPMSGKLANQPCQGAFIHVTDFKQVNGLKIGFHLLQYLKHHYPAFEWVEYREKYWIDTLTGSPSLRQNIESMGKK